MENVLFIAILIGVELGDVRGEGELFKLFVLFTDFLLSASHVSRAAILNELFPVLFSGEGI